MFTKKRYVSPGKPAPMRINMLFVGSSGTAKKTLLRRLAESYEVEIRWKASHGGNTADDSGNHEPQPGLRIEEVCCFYYESHAGDCEFHFYDYVKFGDLINNERCSSFLRTYLLEAHRKWINLNVNKYTDKERNLNDERIHVLFTIFTPHALSALLLETVQSVCGLAPIVPVVTKADSMTWEERKDILIDLHQTLKDIARSLHRAAIVDFQEEGEFIDCEEEDAGRCNDDTTTNLQTCDPALLCTIVDTHQPTNELASSVASVEQHAAVMGGESALLVDFPSLHSPITEDTEEKENESSCSSSEKSCVEEVVYTIASHSATSMMLSTESHRSTALPKVRNIFAVICSDSRSSQRCYPWGSVDSLDENYSDFRRLQRLIFESGNLTHLRGLCQEMSMGLLHPSGGQVTGEEYEVNHPQLPSSIPSTTTKLTNTKAKVVAKQQSKRVYVPWIRRVLTAVFILSFSFLFLGALNANDLSALLCFFVLFIPPLWLVMF